MTGGIPKGLADFIPTVISFRLFVTFCRSIPKMNATTTLVPALIIKSVIETVFVAVIAVLFFVDVFPPSFHGWGEATNHSIAGWVVNDLEPRDPVEVQLFIDDVFVTTGVANKPRPDVVSAGWAQDMWHGFEFPLTVIEPGEHVARVYALHASRDRLKRGLQLIGDPIPFRRNEDGTFTDLGKRTKNGPH